jgi:hypothetical protein
LCTIERASFWLAFSNVAPLSCSFDFALDYKPELGSDKTVIFEMAMPTKGHSSQKRFQGIERMRRSLLGCSVIGPDAMN